MIAVDSNLLVYAHRADSTWHDIAANVVRELAEARTAWAIPWPCLHEFVAIVTHPRIYVPPSRLDAVTDQIDAWLESPALVLLTEGPSHWAHLKSLLTTSRVAGAQVHDARIASICLQHGVKELWTADRDFGRFPELVVRNPLAT